MVETLKPGEFTTQDKLTVLRYFREKLAESELGKRFERNIVPIDVVPENARIFVEILFSLADELSSSPKSFTELTGVKLGAQTHLLDTDKLKR